MTLSIINWNVEWATPRSRRTPEILRRIGEVAPEVVCLTETDGRLLSEEGFTICSQPEYGYGLKGYRRKVMLWSRNPWERVDDVGSDSLPPGRFISGITETPLGQVTVVGICIPWFGSRTRDRRKERWEDHGEYLKGLARILNGMERQRLLVMGDFNQVIGPGCRAPKELQAALQDCFKPDLQIVTDVLAFQGRGSIDHIAMSGDLRAELLGPISNLDVGRRISDHFGVWATVSAAASA